MLEKFLKKDKYLDCHLLKHSIHFFYDEIRACCANVKGPVFYSDYNKMKNIDLDWKYIYKERKKYANEINSIFSKEPYPKCCKGCSEIISSCKNIPLKNFPNVVDRIYIQNYMSCNAKCTYCAFGYVERGLKYEVLPIINSMIKNNVLSKNTLVYMSGGEITISPEFEDLFSTLINYLFSQIEIFTSGIKYSKSIEDAFKKNRCRLLISLDSSTPETYKKIKQVDCFDKIVDNIKNYISASGYNAKNNITMKYILVDGVNDNIHELANFINLVKELGIVNIRLDVDCVKYKFEDKEIVPEYYFDLYKEFNKLASEANLKVQTYAQVDAILNKANR